MRALYDLKYYLRSAGGHAEFTLFRGRKLEDARHAAAHALAMARPGDRVLDIGCGRGELAYAFAVDGAEVTAVDYSADAIALASQTVQHPRVRFVHSDATTFYDADGFDVAVAADVVEHLSSDEVERLYRNVSAMLRPAGRLIVHTWPNAWMYRYDYPRRRKEAAARGESWPSDPRSPDELAMHINEQRPSLLRRQLSAAFPYVTAWLADGEDPRGSLSRSFTIAEARAASDVYAIASHRPLGRPDVLARITMDPLTGDGSGVQLSEPHAPDRVVQSEPFVAEVTLRNGSDSALRSFMPNPVRFAYVWFDEVGDRVGGDRGRSTIVPAMRPGESARYPVAVTSPSRAGRYRLRLTLVQELVRWYATAVDITVDVIPNETNNFVADPFSTENHDEPPRRRPIAEPSGLTPPIGPALVEVPRLVPSPNLDMVYRVIGERDAELFERSGFVAVDNIEDSLLRLGRDFDDIRSAYDFGCGCGRVARALVPRLKNAQYTGSDIDEKAVEWLAGAMQPAQFFVNGYLPPLPLEDETFDLVFAWSIFTHLDESYQDAWLGELRRITKPGGSVLLTVSGDAMWDWLAKESTHGRRDELFDLRARWRRDGFLFWDQDGWEAHFPSYYHTSFHTPEYVREHWSDWFDVVDIVRGGAWPAQDMVIMRR